MKKIIIYILFPLSLSLISCDPVKRHNKLVERYPYVHQDVTQKINDTTTIYIPQLKHDTTVVTKPNDTIYIQKERLRIKVVRELDTLYIEGECMADTIIVTKEITAPLYISTKNKNKNLQLIIIFILFILGLLFLHKIFK